MKISEIFENMTYGPAPENASEAFKFLDKFEKKFPLFINGEWQKSDSGVFIKTFNPSDNSELAEISSGSPKDVDDAVKAAKNALKPWVSLGGHGRAKYLYAIARQVQKHSRLFAVLESLDNGKPVRETRDIDIPLVARHFYHHAGWASLMETELPDYQEVGVIGQIIPWNFPMLMLSWKIAPALAMGNTVVLKPAEFTSLTALLFAEICKNVGLPKGVVNILTGDGKTGAEIVNHPGVDKIAFTGSTEVGKIIRKAIAGSGKKLSLELGGKSPFIVFEDADLDSVVEGIVDAIWFNQGQVCCAGSRLLVQESVAEKLYSKIKKRMEKLRMGNSLDKCIDIGAVVDQTQWNTIDGYVKKGIEEGNQIWQPTWECPKGGQFYLPTLFTDVPAASIIAQEEIFGPVLVAMTFRHHKEAVILANNTRYGLAASIWTENINLALDIAPQIKAGTIWINSSNVFDAASGFGGYRESGFGREGGKEGLFEYVKPKVEKEFPENAPKVKISKTKIDFNPSGIDKTAKHYIGGKQVRPDSGYSINITSPWGDYIGEMPEGTRKDIRNAVEAAAGSTSWGSMTGHARAQVLYFIAENLSSRAKEFAEKISLMTGQTLNDAEKEVEVSIQRIFAYAAYADKYDGQVHSTTSKNVTLAMPEALGVLGIVCSDENPLLGFLSLLLPALAMGNNVVIVPSEKHPFSATDFYQILETSDVPAGTVNIITGRKDELASEMAKHFNIDGLWYFGTKEGSEKVEALATESMKRTWVNYGKHRIWLDSRQGFGDQFLRNATQIKNIWIPYGA
ncbi:MAG: aldehyde dehydrogenase family protein [Cytophagaceae bacterium]|nr:aldehyde dehydrogenase family protein [Cytophagaceae bacterium]